VVNWQKIKTALEWAHLGKFVLDLVAAISSWKLVKKLLSYIPQISNDWATIIAWIVAAGVLFLLIWWQEKRKTAVQGSTSQAPSSALLNSSAFDATAYFATAYTSTMHQDIETRVRAAAQLHSPTDCEAFYLKLIATGLPAFTYEIAWSYIFRSQILALMQINRRLMPIAEVKAFYDKAAIETPNLYANYPFEQWMEFLKSHSLIIWHPSGMVEITIRGRDFLKYLTHVAHYPDDRKF
jgi:hypothetical protein